MNGPDTSPNNFENQPTCVLVIGVDGSGKSTFLNELAGQGYKIQEPTSTAASLEFKAKHINSTVDKDFVDERELLFTGLNLIFDGHIASQRLEGGHIATTGNALVTSISHAVMRQVIGENVTPASRIDDWVSNPASVVPDVIVHIYAPFNTLMERIRARQDQGDINERFWGFNAPIFLNAYQESWRQLLPHLEDVGIRTLALDSAKLCPKELMSAFNRHFSPLMRADDR